MITEELSQVFRVALDGYSQNVHTALPGIIESYNAGLCQATVQPGVLKKIWDDASGAFQLLQYPVISNVPVVFPRSSGAILRFPIVQGDSCLLLFSERSLDNWLNQGGVVDLGDSRKFALQDAVAIPGLFPFTAVPPTDGAATSVVLQNEEGYFEVEPTGKFKMVSKSASDEFLQIVSDGFSALLSAIPVCGGMPGNFDPATVAAIQAIVTRIGNVKG